jgi:hypothetical protein
MSRSCETVVFKEDPAKGQLSLKVKKEQLS